MKKAISLKAPPENARYLRDAGFSVVSLANNHILDYGADSAQETIDLVRRNGIDGVGAGVDLEKALCEASFSVNGLTFAFIAFSMGGANLGNRNCIIAGMDEQLVNYRIMECVRKHDFVIVSLHWGTENVFYPSLEQQVFARCCIDAGASVILGHHPHRLQGIEQHGEGLIFYSLGNFNFFPCEPDLCPHSKLTAIAEIQFQREGGLSYKIIPAVIDENYCPMVIKEEEDIRAFQKHIHKISMPLSSGIDKWWWYGEIAKPYLIGNGRSMYNRIKKFGPNQLYPLIRWLTGSFCRKVYFGILYRLLMLLSPSKRDV